MRTKTIERADLSEAERARYKITDCQICKVPYDPKDHDSWLRARKSGIGGSDIAATCGLSPYMSLLQLYKTKQDEYEAREPSVSMKKGTVLEDYVRNTFVIPEFRKLGYRVVKPDTMFTRDDSLWLFSNVDGLAIPRSSKKKHQIVEIKFVTEYGESAWDTPEYEGIPSYYYAQVQSYMWTLKADVAVVYALFERTWTVKTYTIAYNAFFVHEMLNDGKKFWETNILMDIPPAPSLKLDTEDYADRLAETFWMPDTREDPEASAVCEQIVNLKAQIKSLSKDVDDLTDKLSRMVLEEGKYTPRFSVSKYVTERIDTTRLKRELPDVAKEYTKQTPCVKTTIK